MRRLRVMHVNLGLGGMGRYGALFARALAQREDIDTLSVLNQDLLQSQRIRQLLKNVPKVAIPALGIRSRSTLPVRLHRIISQWKPDVIHDSAGSGYIYGIMALAAVAGNTSLVVTEHDPEPHLGMGTSWTSRLSRYLVRRRSQHIFVHGPGGRNALIQRGVPDKRISVIYHGSLALLFDTSPLQQPSSREKETVLFFGELRPNKGFHLLVPIADRVHATNPGVKFIVAGSRAVARDLRKTGWGQQLQQIISEMQKRSYFEIHDRFILDDEVGGFFQRATVTLLPYLDATQSGVVMMAMPFESVVLATKVGDLPYVIQDGITGLLAEPKPEDIADKLSLALSDPIRLEEVRRRAKAWVEKNGDWRCIVDQSLSVYRECAW